MKSFWKQNQPAQYKFDGNDYRDIVMFTFGVVMTLMITKVLILLGYIGY